MPGLPTKYHELAELFRRQIRDGALTPGQPLPSEAELAAQHRVNRLTLRKAFTVLEREGVIVRRRGRGTYVHTDLPSSQTSTILYIGDTDSHLLKDLYIALTREAQQHGCAVAGFNPEHAAQALQQSDHLRSLLAGADALICQPRCWTTIATQVPATMPVIWCDPLGVENYAQITRPGYILAADGFLAARIATAHLLANGHRHILFLGPAWRSTENDHPSMFIPQYPQYQGYLTAYHEAGCEEHISKGLFLPLHEQGDTHLYDALIAMPERPTAFVCDADFRAAHLFRVCPQLGLRIPEDVSVVGIGNTPWCEMLNPPLTSVSLEESTLARLTMQLCRQTPPTGVTTLRIAPRLIERRSICAR